jgi:hypothetical protein
VYYRKEKTEKEGKIGKIKKRVKGIGWEMRRKIS